MIDIWKIVGTAALCAAAFAVTVLGPTLSIAEEPDAADKAIKARRGYMQVVGWEAGPLFGMAKGDIEYDAAKAQAGADSLNAIAQYNAGRLFVAGSANTDKPGDTRSLPKIWDDLDGFTKAYTDWQMASANLAAEAGKGKDELTAAVGELGKSCGGCHKPYRAKDF